MKAPSDPWSPFVWGIVFIVLAVVLTLAFGGGHAQH